MLKFKKNVHINNDNCNYDYIVWTHLLDLNNFI